jgi:hypothetical protein
MATNKEMSLPIERFAGVNRNPESEDLSPENLWEAKNLWEKKLGLLETRKGSVELLSELPSNVLKIMDSKKIYRQDGTSRRIAAIQCEPDTGAIALPDGVTMTLSFENDATGYWNKPRTFGGNDFQSASHIFIRFVGFGVDRWSAAIDVTTLTGYDVAEDQKLVYELSGSPGENITGIEFYALMRVGTESNPTQTTQTIWFGYDDLIGKTYPYTKEFLYAPLAQSSAGGVDDDTEVGELSREITFSVGNNTTGDGLLEAGKEYYVAVLPLYLVIGATLASDRRCAYRALDVDLYNNAIIKKVKIPEINEAGEKTNNGYIDITDLSINTITGLVCIGEDPEMLFPVGVYNDSDNNDFEILDMPKAPVSTIDFVPTGFSQYTMQFKLGTYSSRDMFIKVNDDGSYLPVFYSNTWIDASKWSETNASGYRNIVAAGYHGVMGPIGDGSKYDFEVINNKCFFVNDYIPEKGIDFASVIALSGYSMRSRTGSNYSWTNGLCAIPVIQEYQARALLTAISAAGAVSSNGQLSSSTTYYYQVLRSPLEENVDAETDVASVSTGTADNAITLTLPSTAGYTYSIYLGSANDLRLYTSERQPGETVILGSVTTGLPPPVPNENQLPCFKYISNYNESIILSGGESGVNLSYTPGGFADNRQMKDSLYDVYYSRPMNPFNFTIPAQASSVHQTIRVGRNNEPVTGLAIYSNTSGDSGPFSQLVIGKHSEIFIMNDLPSVSGGDSAVRTLSSEVGIASHYATVNTPIGTLILDKDNCYLLRAEGEPAPIGQQISDILRGADLSKACAVYHDRHVKISFYHEDYDCDQASGYHNVEFWLNINKMIEGKGQPDWVGPMVGVFPQSCNVEDHKLDTIVRRVCSAGNERMIYFADVDPIDTDDGIYDFDQQVESAIETKDFEISPEDNNWNKLLKRLYWKLKVNRLSNDPVRATEYIYVDGALFSERNLTFYADRDVAFDKQPLKLYPSFPAGRPRGRIFKLRIEFEGRVGIGGFQLNYEIEKRRI